jgi:hypothetical protein
VHQLLSVSTTQETLAPAEYDAQVAQQHKAISAIKQSDKQFEEKSEEKSEEKKDDSEDEVSASRISAQRLTVAG